MDPIHLCIDVLCGNYSRSIYTRKQSCWFNSFGSTESRRHILEQGQRAPGQVELGIQMTNSSTVTGQNVPGQNVSGQNATG